MTITKENENYLLLRYIKTDIIESLNDFLNYNQDMINCDEYVVWWVYSEEYWPWVEIGLLDSSMSTDVIPCYQIKYSQAGKGIFNDYFGHGEMKMSTKFSNLMIKSYSDLRCYLAPQEQF